MTLHHGDCVEVMAQLDPASVDAIVTDPPYGLEFMGKEWDRLLRTTDRPGVDERFRGRRTVEAYKAGEPAQEWHHRWATEALRVAKPGVYLLAFGGTRTYHRLAVAIEDAGWIIRDCLVWAYASGFPKGRANLKPAWEPIVMARKPGPLRPLAIDECRIPTSDADAAAMDRVNTPGSGRFQTDEWAGGGWPASAPLDTTQGRWPANLILTDPIFDGDVEGVIGGGETAGAGASLRTLTDNAQRESGFHMGESTREIGGDSGTYSRFFLIPKAARSEREPVFYPDGHDRSKRFTTHPTVKPVDLMRHLLRLVTPAGGTVLDPFLGSGTTAIAAETEGFAWIGIEREAEYVKIAEARLMGVQKGLGLTA